MTASSSDSFEWAFHYAGPLESLADSRCITCRSAQAAECLAEHGKRPMTGCAHCHAAQGGGCHAHWGLASALAYYEQTILPTLPTSCAADYATVKPLLPPLKKRSVVVDMRSSRPGGGEPREVFIRAIERD